MHIIDDDKESHTLLLCGLRLPPFFCTCHSSVAVVAAAAVDDEGGNATALVAAAVMGIDGRAMAHADVGGT